MNDEANREENMYTRIADARKITCAMTTCGLLKNSEIFPGFAAIKHIRQILKFKFCLHFEETEKKG